MQFKKSLSFKILYSFALKIFGSGSAFLVSILIARSFGAELSGIVFFSISSLTIISTFCLFGLDRTVLRMVSEPSSSSDTGYCVLSIALLSVTASSVTIIAFINVVDVEVLFKSLDERTSSTLITLSPGILFQAINVLLCANLQAKARAGTSIVCLNIATNMLLLLGLILFSQLSLNEFAYYYVFCTGASVLITILVSLKFRVFTKVPRTIRVVFYSCFPLWLVAVSFQFSNLSGLLVAGFWLFPEEIAQIAVAQRTAVLISFVLVATNVVVAPKFAVMYKANTIHDLNSIASGAAMLTTIVIMPVFVLICLYPAKIMTLFGEEFKQSASLLVIYSLGQVINVATGSVGFLLSMTGNEDALMRACILGALVSIISSIFLIPILGSSGAAISTATALVVQNILCVLYAKKKLNISIFQWRLKSIKYFFK